jgi:hypothetical protein
MGNWKVIVPSGRKNYFVDPAFWKGGCSEVDSEWSKLGTGTFLAQQSKRYFGYMAAEAKLVSGSLTQYQTIVNDHLGTHTLSCYALYDLGDRLVTDARIKAYWDGAAVSWDSITPVEGIDTGWYHCVYTTHLASFNPTSTNMGVIVYTPDMWVDGCQFEEGSQYSTFINADEPGCFYKGEKYRSMVERSGNFRGGGAVKDLKDDYDFRVTAVQGLGMQMPDIIIDEYGSRSGAQLNQIKSGIREVTIIGSFVTSNLHQARQNLIEILKYDSYPKSANGWQPVTFAYTGTSPRRFFSGHVSKGLEGNWDIEALNLQTIEQVAIKLLMPDPTVYGESHPVDDLDARDQPVSYGGCGYRDWEGDWHWPFDIAALSYNDCNDILIASSGQVYIAIANANIQGNSNWDYFIAWDPVTETFWQPGATQAGGANINGYVYRLAEDSQGNIYAGGALTTIGTDTNVHYVAKYDPATDTWNNLSTGMNAVVRGLSPAIQGGMYISGEFTARFGGTVGDYNRVIHYDPSGPTWTALESGGTTNGVDDKVYGSDVNPSGHLFLAGDFDKAGDAQIDANCVCGYDPDEDEFYTLAGGLVRSGLAPYARKVIATWDGLVYFRVYADTAGSITCNTALMIWNGTGWENIAVGASGAAQDDTLKMQDMALGPDGILYVAGTPGSPDGLDAYTWTVARKGTVWRNIDAWIASTGPVQEYTTCVEVGLVDPTNNKRYILWIGSTSTGAVVRHCGQTIYTYAGNQPYQPKIHIHNNSSGVRRIMEIRNATTGAALDLNYELQAGDQLIIDLQAGTITSLTFGNINHVVLPASDWADFYLTPGENSLTTFADDNSDLMVYMFVRNAFDGVD